MAAWEVREFPRVIGERDNALARAAALEGALRALIAAHDSGTENDLKRTYGTDWERADEIRQLIRANEGPELETARALLAESTPSD